MYVLWLLHVYCKWSCFLDTEIEICFSHVTKFLSSTTQTKAWENLFSLKQKVGIGNILQIVEICVVIPVSNAEVKYISY